MTWLAENPVAIWCGGAVLATLAVVVYLQTRTRGPLVAVLVIVLLTAVLLVAERLIVTPREAVAIALDQLTARIEANDLPGVLTFIAPAAKTVRADAESLMPLVTVDRARIVSTPEIAVDMEANPPTATVNCQGLVDVTVKQNGIKGPYLDHVQIRLVRSGERWLVESYTPEKDWHRKR
jgi:regulator of protease activity HflC (stomatin/prohibitin superfamily)